MDLAEGRVLDVGVGAGRHALALQASGKDVVGLDPSPGAVEVARQRGVDARLGSIAAPPADIGRFDALLLLGNNLGLLTHAAEQGMAAARNLLRGAEGRPFAPVPYFWSDQYDMRIQAYGYLRGHEEVRVVEGALSERHFIAAYRTGDRLVGVLAVGAAPKALRPWRQAIAKGSPWDEAVAGSPQTTGRRTGEGLFDAAI
ncbi:methyltransferase domain-containing protein [Nocardiopsis sp. ARC36]